MKYTLLAFFRRICAFFTAAFLALTNCASNTSEKQRPPVNTVTAYDTDAADYRLTSDVNEALHPISDTLFGIFFEDINFAADGGLYAEMVSNRSFAFTSLAANDALYGWSAAGNAALRVSNDDPAGALNQNNPSYLIIENTAETLSGAENRGFTEGMAIRAGKTYNVSFYARSDTYRGQVTLRLLAGETVAAQAEISGMTGDWQKFEASVTSAVTASENVRLSVLIGQGTAAFDMVSMFPADTYLQEENGLRADLCEKLAELQPKFLRFPGGCVIEGYDDATDYSWKDSVGADENGEPLLFNGRYGDVAARRQGVNIWTDLNATQDVYPSFMSYGLGFYEFFRLCKDLGAAPVPVLNCGLYCQMRGMGPVDMESGLFARYVQDMLDLVEFANGDVTSKWGAVRASMGQTEPFGLKYICIGNENEGTDYYERYTAFLNALHNAQETDPALYGEIELIYSAGASDATHGANYIKAYAYAEEWMQKNGEADLSAFAAAVDQHYYNSPAWFLQNADYYDAGKYGRTAEEITATRYGGAIPVFLGEYAARTNTLESALAEAAFMTGLERNGDIVKMACYAPLFGNTVAGHWSPDLIWYNNGTSFASVNYNVQKLFSRNTGAFLLSSSLDGAAVPQANIKGKVGVGTWYTSAAFDNVLVKSNQTGKTLGKDSFFNPLLRLNWTTPTDGKFRVKNGRLVQSDTDMRYTETGSVAYFGDETWEDYTLTLDAEKLAGNEGFLICFGVQDTENNYFWNIGGWDNTVSCLQQISGGAKTGQIPGTVRPFTAETGRTYRLKVCVSGRNVKCYIDGELYADYTAGSDCEAECYQVVSRDKNGDVIVKLVNATASSRTLACDLGGLACGSAAVSQLAGQALSDVNTAEKESCPITEFTLTGLSERFNLTVPQYSLTVLRFSETNA